MNHAAPIVNARYHLLEPVGAGGMGMVYRAHDRFTGQTVALKQVQVAPQTLAFASRPAATDTKSLLLALTQEFKLLASLRHPNIISVLDYGFDANRQPYFTMELLDQPQTLLEAGRGQPLPVQLDLLIQTLQALAYLHRRGILHRDLKPENVLVSQNRVRVLDFGLSIARSQATLADVSGTLRYLAPEVLAGGVYSEAADLYSIGVIAYELLVGQHPFASDNIDKLILQVLEKQPDLYPLLQLTPPGGKRILPALVWRLLEKQPALRYASAVAVIEDLYAVLGRPPPPESVAIRESFLQAASFVGRESELTQLTAALEKSLQGEGGTWLIGGESGVGKSRLLDELRTRALVAGAIVLRGQAVEGGGLPYQLWREPLRRLVIASEISDAEAGVLKEVVPEIERLLERPVADIPKLPQAEGHERLGLTVVEVLKRQTMPIVMLLEDLHWSAESLFILQRLNLFVSEQPWLIIGSYRDDERPHLPDELSEMHLIKLDRLNTEEIVALSRAILGEVGQQTALLNLLEQQTEGNTFFMVEVLRALAEEAGRLSAIGQMTLPASFMAQGVRTLLQRRLLRMPAWTQPLLKLAALHGREIDRSVLQGLTSTVALEQWLQIAAEAAVLEIHDERWRFAHDKLREEVIAQIEPTEKRQLFHQIAETVEIVYPHDNSRAEILLGYWRAAQEPAKALPHLLFVARERVELGINYQETRELLLEGLTWSRTQPDSNQQQSALLKRLGDIHLRQGDYPAAQLHYNESLHLAEQTDDPLLRSNALHGLGMIAWRQGELAQAMQYIQTDLLLARRAGDQEQIIAALLMVAILYSEQADYATARDTYQQCIALAQTNGDVMSVILALINLGNDEQMQQNYPAALDCLSKALQAARDMQARRYIAHALSILAIVSQKQCDPAGALDSITQAVTMDRELGDRFGLAHDLVTRGGIQLDLNMLAEARRSLSEGLQLAQAIGGAPILLHALLGFARFMLASGDAEQAAELCGLIRAHPALTPEVQQTDLAKLLAKLATVLPTLTLTEAQERGQRLALPITITQLLKRTE